MHGKALILLITLVMALVMCQMAFATGEGTYSVREYPLPANATVIGAMTVDQNGNLWLIQNEPPVIYKLGRENGTFTNFTIKGFEKAGFEGISVDDTGIVWFADPKKNRFGAYDAPKNQTAYFDFPGPMAPSSVLRRGDLLYIGCKDEVGEYDLRFPDEPLKDNFVAYGSFVKDIRFDRFANVWFVEYDSNKVGVYWRMYDKISDFVIPTNNSYPTCLSIDSLGRMWFVESGVNKLGMYHTELFNFSEYEMTAVDGKVPKISDVATAGDTVWLTDPENNRVLLFIPDERRFVAAQLADNAMPTFIEADANGMLWAYESGTKKLASLNVTDQFGKVTPMPSATVQPTATATPQPTKTPGFLGLTVIAGLVLALFLCRARK